MDTVRMHHPDLDVDREVPASRVGSLETEGWMVEITEPGDQFRRFAPPGSVVE